ncbi:hypothetical protein CFter6_2871 [Collimonas fungivorans]|uniref:Uncharacterized protein n=2 Tax=Collimonas fungivorans TaxID=158899 RepID=A0A127PCS0_9BURK|nr:hypothetical protein CFter6_2871 [Collimonas fungivorans]
MARPIDQHPAESPGWSPGVEKEINVVAIALGRLSINMSLSQNYFCIGDS